MAVKTIQLSTTQRDVLKHMQEGLVLRGSLDKQHKTWAMVFISVPNEDGTYGMNLPVRPGTLQFLLKRGVITENTRVDSWLPGDWQVTFKLSDLGMRLLAEQSNHPLRGSDTPIAPTGTTQLLYDSITSHMVYQRFSETRYHLRIYVPTGGNDRLPVAIASELVDNPGRSITNFAEELASAALAYLLTRGHRHERIHWVEHFAPGLSFVVVTQDSPEPLLKAERFSLVAFDPGDWSLSGPFPLCNPRWESCTLLQVEDLIGMPWDPVSLDSMV